MPNQPIAILRASTLPGHINRIQLLLVQYIDNVMNQYMDIVMNSRIQMLHIILMTNVSSPKYKFPMSRFVPPKVNIYNERFCISLELP